MAITLQDYLTSLQGKRVAVIGIGVSNTPLIKTLLQAGISVTACDKAPRTAFGALADELESMGAVLHLGDAYLDGLDQDVIFRSPGIRPDIPPFLSAMEKGSALTSEMEVFFQVCPCKIIAVTGSDGKTTTTTIISEFLKEAGKTVYVGGNIGKPLLPDVADMDPEDFAVLELSSFQLMTMEQSPNIAVITNLAPNHLDYHHTMEEYTNAKKNIFLHQGEGDRLILNYDNEVTRSMAAEAVCPVTWFSRKERLEEGVYLRDNAIWLTNEMGSREVLPLSDIQLPGVHNIENYMAAFAAVRGMVSYETMREIAKTFGGVEHRIELIRTRKGVRWYNDSIASSPSRTIAGLNSFPEKVILIAGGKDKGISYAPLGPVVNDHVKLLLLCGKTAGVIREAVEQAENYHGLEILDVADYHEAVAIADARSQPGDVVILSPASTSFDRFANFMERGQVFKAIVNELK